MADLGSNRPETEKARIWTGMNDGVVDVEPEALSDVQELSPLLNGICGRRSNGTMRCWYGSIWDSPLFKPGGMRDVQDLAVAFMFTAPAASSIDGGGGIWVRHADRSVHLLGVTEMPPHRGSELIAVPQLAGSLQLSGQGRVLCALMAEGTVRCATQKTQETPFAKARELVAKLEFVPLKGVADAVRIGATYDFVCALRKNGQVSCADTDKLDKDASVVLWEQP